MSALLTFIMLLGTGSYSEVWLVEGAKGLFAIKIYKESHWMANGVREDQIGQMLSHPAIIKTYGLTEEGALLMEYVDGVPLSKKQRASRTAAELFVEALSHAWAQGFVHADLKDENLLLDTTGEIHLVDLASFLSFEELTAYWPEKKAFYRPGEPWEGECLEDLHLPKYLRAILATTKKIAWKNPELKQRKKDLSARFEAVYEAYNADPAGKLADVFDSILVVLRGT